MQPFLSIPIEARLTVIFLLGTCIGGAVNWAIYRLAWNPRPISPWSPRDPSAPPRRAWDRLPIIGWFGLRREAKLHGTGFWVRPMLLELLAGTGFAWLYWWEVEADGLLPAVIQRPLAEQLQSILMFQFAAHCVLIALMLAASMIDADEKIIPDEITIPGTLVGLLIAAVWPRSLLMYATSMGDLEFLHVASPNACPAWLGGFPLAKPLVLGLACWWLWCVAILPRTWYSRHGCIRAMQLCLTRIVRTPATYRILRMAVMGSLAIALVWFRGGSGWEWLFSALVGMAAGGGLVWMVRVVGSAVLQREAMGFGDVTLMAMIGAYLGWQPCLMIFFLAPFAGLVVGLLRLIVLRDKEIPYGPFLCLAALFVIVRWNAVWEYTEHVFELGWIVPLLMLGCMPLMALMLITWRLILGAALLIVGYFHAGQRRR
jgi:leader peptidase (prepilin peptidase) / N-methyltransferase